MSELCWKAVDAWSSTAGTDQTTSQWSTMGTPSPLKYSSKMRSKPLRSTPSRCVRMCGCRRTIEWPIIAGGVPVRYMQFVSLLYVDPHPQTSDYPVIISLENHCSVEQQEVIAHHMSCILGSALVTAPLGDGMPTNFPSPQVRSCFLKMYLIMTIT